MLAVIKTGGKQYIVKPGDTIEVEKLETKEGQEIVFSDVLLVQDDKAVSVGTPLVKDAKVTAKVVAHGKDDKIVIFKYKPKKRYARKIGHRQPFTKIEIVKIEN